MGDWTDFDFSTVSSEYNMFAVHLAIKRQAIENLQEIRQAMKCGAPVDTEVFLATTPVNLQHKQLEYVLRGTECPEMKSVRDDLVQANKSLDGRLEVRGPELYFVIPK